MRIAVTYNGLCANIIEADSLETIVPMFPGADLIDASEVDIGIGWKWSNGVWAPLPPPPPDTTAVNAERDRRIAFGHTFAVTGYGDIPLQGRLQDQINLQARLIAAQGYKAADVTAPVLILRDAENVNHTLTPDQMIELVMAGMAWIEETMMVSWAMKDGTTPFEAGIPADFTDDAYWP